MVALAIGIFLASCSKKEVMRAPSVVNVKTMRVSPSSHAAPFGHQRVFAGQDEIPDCYRAEHLLTLTDGCGSIHINHLMSDNKKMQSSDCIFYVFDGYEPEGITARADTSWQAP